MISSAVERHAKSLWKFAHRLPKVELHAHLNGCVSRSTLKAFAEEDKIRYPEEVFPVRNLAGAFEMFSVVHRTVNTLERQRQVLLEVLKSFKEDNVVYLELRTTPKKLNGCSKEDYITMVLQEIERFNSQSSNFYARLLLSINRGEPLENGQELVELAKTFRKSYKDTLVGIDFSGNPIKGNFSIYVPMLTDARDAGLKLTVHVGEVKNEREVDEILDFAPDRLGHFNFYTKSQRLRLLDAKIPIEMCPTSNLITLNLNSLKEHHFRDFYDVKHPIAICTDDTTMIEGDLTDEFVRVAETFGLTQDEVGKSVSYTHLTLPTIYSV
eukprot:TRINITY_DN8664_c0_g1_i3.p1 TRINITY_DN8664_c0_g1~~TRINITY_DN8664_c0_g1_i3.p1  ORF type:complete len:325 (-),score=68.84 TRINITY_DN8664_c0_g1_i3:36-1010(-)